MVAAGCSAKNSKAPSVASAGSSPPAASGDSSKTTGEPKKDLRGTVNQSRLYCSGAVSGATITIWGSDAVTDAVVSNDGSLSDAADLQAIRSDVPNSTFKLPTCGTVSHPRPDVHHYEFNVYAPDSEIQGLGFDLVAQAGFGEAVLKGGTKFPVKCSALWDDIIDVDDASPYLCKLGETKAR